MTDKELKKLKKAELFEILFYLQKELEEVKQENEKLKQQFDNIGANNISDSDIKRIADAVKATLNETAKVGSKKNKRTAGE